MPGLIENQQTGTRRDLTDYITNLQREETPLFTMLTKDTVRASTFETQVDDYGATDDIGGVGTGEDANDFKNMAENRGVVTNQVIKMRETPAVDDFAENVNENEALPAGEYAEAVRKAAVRLKFRAEKRLLSEVEASRQEGGTKYGTCSIGGFIKSTAPSGTQTVPEKHRTPSAQIYTGTLAALSEKDISAICQEIFESTNGLGRFKGVFGSSLKRRVSEMSIYRPDVASNTVIERINRADNSTLETKVDIIVGDFGTIEIIPSTRVRYFASDGSVTTQAQRRGSGYILDLTRWGLAFKRKPGHKPLEDKGGGPRGIVDTIFGLRCKGPKASGKIAVSS